MDVPQDDMFDKVAKEAADNLSQAKADLNAMLEAMYTKKNWRQAFEKDFKEATDQLFKVDGTGKLPTFLTANTPHVSFVMAFVEAVVNNRVYGLPAQRQEWYHTAVRTPRKKYLRGFM
jgi:hypothetical protein